MNINHFKSVHTLITVVSVLTPIQGIILSKHHKAANMVLDDGIQSLTSPFFPFPSSLARSLRKRERESAYAVSLGRL